MAKSPKKGSLRKIVHSYVYNKLPKSIQRVARRIGTEMGGYTLTLNQEP